MAGLYSGYPKVWHLKKHLTGCEESQHELLTNPGMHRVLRPGGWVQLVEIYFNVQSDNGSITERHALRQWSTQYLGCLGEAKDLRVGTRLRNLLIAGGLTEVDARMIPLPLSAWSSGKAMIDHLMPMKSLCLSRPANARNRYDESRQYSKPPSIHGALPIYSTSPYGSRPVREPGSTCAARG